MLSRAHAFPFRRHIPVVGNYLPRRYRRARLRSLASHLYSKPMEPLRRVLRAGFLDNHRHRSGHRAIERVSFATSRVLRTEGKSSS